MAGENAVAAIWQDGIWSTVAPLPGSLEQEPFFTETSRVLVVGTLGPSAAQRWATAVPWVVTTQVFASYGEFGWSPISGIPSNNAEGDLTSVSCTPATAGLQTCVAVDNIGAFNDIVPGTRR